MRKNIFLYFSIIFLFVGICSNAQAKTVALACFSDNPDYKESEEAFKQALLKKFSAGKPHLEFITIDGKGDRTIFMEELKKAEPGVDLFFVPGTHNALAVKEAGITKPVIFAAVVDPLGVGLVKSLGKPDSNFTGTFCAVPEERQLKMLLLVVPNVKKIGILYSAGDQVSTAQAKKWEDAIAVTKLGAEKFLIPEDAASTEALAAAAKEMVGKVDVIVTVAESKISQFGEGVIEAAKAGNVPYYSCLSQLVKKGALLSLGFDFATAAKISAEQQAAVILEGKGVPGIPVITFPKYEFCINLNTAKQLKLGIREDVLLAASEVIE